VQLDFMSSPFGGRLKMSEDMSLNGEILTENLLHSIIDELHPGYVPASDEGLIEDYEDHGVFERSFLHLTGKVSTIRWKVYYGTPETVVTVFDSIYTTDK
jgi:hypothetical protein